MSAGVHNMRVYQGTTYRSIMTWRDPDNQPIDLTGWTAEMQARARANATTPLLTLTSSPAAGLVLGGAAGTIDLTITPAQSMQFNWKSAVYDLKLTGPGGDPVTVLLRGTITVDPAITR